VRGEDRVERALAARAAVLDVAERFSRTAVEVVPGAVRGRLEALVADAGLSAADAAALRTAAERAIQRGVAAMAERLADPGVWLDPLVLPEGRGPREDGWSPLVPHWLARLLAPRARVAPRPERLDDPGNRVWIALSLVARALDPVLEEFGLAPTLVPGIGGRYRLHPGSAWLLDPSGRLSRLWGEYRTAYGRFAELSEG
jgi:hypothetical protein